MYDKLVIECLQEYANNTPGSSEIITEFIRQANEGGITELTQRVANSLGYSRREVNAALRDALSYKREHLPIALIAEDLDKQRLID